MKTVTKLQLNAMIREAVRETIQEIKADILPDWDNPVVKLLDKGLSFSELVDKILRKMTKEEILLALGQLSRTHNVPLKKENIKTHQSRMEWLREIEKIIQWNEIFDDVEATLSSKRSNKIFNSLLKDFGIKENKLNTKNKQTLKENRSLFDEMVPMEPLSKLFSRVSKEDKQAYDLLEKIYIRLRDEMKVEDNVEAAYNRLQQMMENGEKWDIALLRNNIFKAANLLGIELPSGMF